MSRKISGLFMLLLISGLFLPTVFDEADAAEDGKIGTQIADYILKQWRNPDTITVKQWEYSNGIIFYGMELIYKQSNDLKYYNYIKSWVDKYVNYK